MGSWVFGNKVKSGLEIGWVLVSWVGWVCGGFGYKVKKQTGWGVCWEINCCKYFVKVKIGILTHKNDDISIFREID